MIARTTPACMVLFILAFTPSAVMPQQAYRLRSDMAARAELSFTGWKAGNDRVSEFAVPFSVKYPVNENLQVYLMTAPALSRLVAGNSFSLSGLSDIKAGGHVLFLDEKLLFTFGLNLPAGKSRLTPDEWAVASVISRQTFSFKVPCYGQGFDAQAGLSSAFAAGDWMLGGGISYLRKGGFVPYSTSDIQYVPGDEVTFTLGVNRGGFYGDILYSLYFDDTWGGNPVFKSGSTLLLQLLSVIDRDPWDIVFFIRERMKMKSKTISGTGVLAYERLNRNGNQLDLQAAAWYTLRPGVKYTALLRLKLYSDNDFGYGGVTLFGPGAGVEAEIAPGLLFSGELAFGVGTYQTMGGRVSLSGFSGSAGLQTSF
ncbi:hypothetical protein JXO52_11530 [bacterium]|nr:hypothetical protein [bacterium]